MWQVARRKNWPGGGPKTIRANKIKEEAQKVAGATIDHNNGWISGPGMPGVL